MWRFPQNVPAPAEIEKEPSGTMQVVRRIEVTVERQICSLEVHGTGLVPMPAGSACPVCGQTLAAPPEPGGRELAGGKAPRHPPEGQERMG